jgi:hypothetical protein
MIKAEVYETGKRLEKEMERWGISDQYFELLTNLVTQAAMATDTDPRLEELEAENSDLKYESLKQVNRVLKLIVEIERLRAENQKLRGLLLEAGE